MKKILLLAFGALLFGAMPAYGWGRLGHSTVAKIAEDYLTPKAKKCIDKEYNQSDFGVDHLVMSICRVFSCVIGRWCLL